MIEVPVEYCLYVLFFEMNAIIWYVDKSVYVLLTILLVGVYKF